MDILLKPTLLSWVQSVLAYMIPIVGRIHNVCVVENAKCVESLYDLLNQLIYRLKSLQSCTIEVIIECNDCIVKLGLLADPAYT